MRRVGEAVEKAYRDSIDAAGLKGPGRRTAFSYRSEFATKKDEWIEVRVPVRKFVATSFGRVVRNQPLNAEAVTGIGILLGDKQSGPFKLEVDWIKAT